MSIASASTTRCASSGATLTTTSCAEPSAENPPPSPVRTSWTVTSGSSTTLGQREVDSHTTMRSPRLSVGAASAANGMLTVVCVAPGDSTDAGTSSPACSGRASTLPTACAGSVR